MLNETTRCLDKCMVATHETAMNPSINRKRCFIKSVNERVSVYTSASRFAFYGSSLGVT